MRFAEGHCLPPGEEKLVLRRSLLQCIGHTDCICVFVRISQLIRPFCSLFPGDGRAGCDASVPRTCHGPPGGSSSHQQPCACGIRASPALCCRTGWGMSLPSLRCGEFWASALVSTFPSDFDHVPSGSTSDCGLHAAKSSCWRQQPKNLRWLHTFLGQP